MVADSHLYKMWKNEFKTNIYPKQQQKKML